MARITLIDDEPRLADTFARILRRAGHEVRTAGTFAEIETEMLPDRFDVLVTDLFLPGRNGCEIIAELCRRGCTAPMILISGAEALLKKSFVPKGQPFAWLLKPVTKAMLLEVVDRALEHARGRARS